MTRLLQRAIHRAVIRFFFPTTPLWLTVEEDREGVLAEKVRLWYRPKLAHEEHEATGLSAIDVAAEAAASVTAALDRWQAAEDVSMARRGVSV